MNIQRQNKTASDRGKIAALVSTSFYPIAPVLLLACLILGTSQSFQAKIESKWLRPIITANPRAGLMPHTLAHEAEIPRDKFLWQRGSSSWPRSQPEAAALS